MARRHHRRNFDYRGGRGTVGPIAFWHCSSSAGDQLFGIPDAASQLGVLVALVVVFTLSAISGIDRGIAPPRLMSHSP